MDINTERLITAIRNQGFSIPHAGVLGNRLMLHDNPPENLKNAGELYNTQLQHLNDEDFIAIIFALIELHFDDTITDVEFEEENEEDPGVEPQCPHEDEGAIDCEYEIRHGENWCNTHNCYA